MSDAHNYYKQCLEQNYTPEQAEEYTKKYFPDFIATPTPPLASNQLNATNASANDTGVWAIQTANNGLLFTKIAAFLMKAFSFGLAFPWANCMVIEKWANNVRIDGRGIRFTGCPSDLFKIWIKVFLLSMLTAGLYYLFVGRKAVAAYIDSHIKWA